VGHDLFDTVVPLEQEMVPPLAAHQLADHGTREERERRAL
jgi:hypothetical protein